MQKNIGHLLKIDYEEIPFLKDRLVFNEEKELTGMDDKRITEPLKKSDVFILFTKTENYKEQTSWLGNQIKDLQLKSNQWIYETFPTAKTPEEYKEVFDQFKTKTLIKIKENDFKLIMAFGKESCYPFFKSATLLEDGDWFTKIHSRFHLKKLKNPEQSLIVYCLPSLKVCSNPEIEEDIKLSLQTIRGYLLDQGIVSKSEDK